MVVICEPKGSDSENCDELFYNPSSRKSCLAVSGGTAGGTANMTEEMLKASGTLSGPGADCNSNHTNNGETTASYMSNASSQHDIDFIQDNSDYQWFLDYGYRDSVHHHVSVLSGIESGLYDDLAVAEVDMEHFQIRSLLHTLPAMCKTDLQTGIDSNHPREMFASVTGSMMAQFEFEPSISPHSSSQGEDSAGSTDAMSLCKSELLFSPVKESSLPGTINFSVDSLDSDIMLTCQANKDNYTIAFEGSTTMCSEDSDYQENVESDTASSEGNNWSRCTRVVNPQVAAVKSERHTLLNTSLGSGGETAAPAKGSPGGRHLAGNMARSDSVFTTWSKLNGTKTEHPLDTQQLSRHPSGNNNTRIENGDQDPAADNTRIGDDNTDSAVKSRSLPNLARQQLRRCLANKTNAGSTSVSSVESMCVKLYDVQNHSSPLTSSGASSSSSGGRLVRLFMKQRSGSSIASDCWDSDSCVRSTSYVGKKTNRNVNRSTGPMCNTVSCPGDRDMAALCPQYKVDKDGKKEVVDASVFEDSLYRDDGAGVRSHDQIAEEDVDGPSEQSESIERVSESISKVNTLDRDSTFENVRTCSNYSSHHGHLPGGSTPEGPCQCKRFNVNNNNSVENEPNSRRDSRGSICSCNSCSCGSGRCAVHRHSGTQVPVPLISRSIQTSCILDVISKTALLEEKESKEKEKEKEIEKEENAKEIGEKDVETTEQTTVVSGLSFDKAEEKQKPVYVYYPNYALPDLGFLREKQQIDLTKVYLKPQKFTSGPVIQNLLSKVPACLRQPPTKQKRPFSCNDIEDLRKKGFGHVRDWNSLAMLLPNEYRQYLAEIPEVSEQLDGKSLPQAQPLFCMSSPKTRNPCDCTNLSSSSSTNTQPSSGYRGSSTLLSDSSSPAPNFNPMFVYRYDSVSSEASLNQTDRKKNCQGPPLPKRSISLPSAGKGAKKGPMEVPPPPRPPLPKGILRHPSDDCNPKLRKETNNKRYSMFEMGLTDKETRRREALNDLAGVLIRARSRSEDGLGGTTTEEDEGVDAVSERYGHDRECCDHANFEEVLRLSDFLHMSETGLTEGSGDEWDQDKMNKLRVQVSRFLSANGCEVADACRSNCVGTCACDRKVVTFNTDSENGKEKLKTPPNSPIMSAAHIIDHRYQCKLQQTPPLSDLPIREEDSCDASTATAALSAKSPVDIQQKKELISAVSDAVEKVINHFSSGVTLIECNRLGDSTSSPAVAEVVLGWLCPALYAVLSDGLLPSISSAFGDIGNSVWQVVEASAQQGPMTRSLNELVLRLNSEDVFAEGLLKFNAFIFGLLNVRSMDAWVAYLRTRESILRKHYSPESLLVLSSCGGPQYRALTDRLLAALRPLTLLPFRLDLLFECRQLHQSLQRLSQPAASPSGLIRLLRSIQTSVGQIPATQEEHNLNFTWKNTVGGVATDGGEQPAPTLRRVSRSGAARQLRRPRSCVEPPADIDRNDPTNVMCKRWSGVQLGSKLSQALDRLMAEDTEEEYTDSIEREALQNRQRPSHQSDNSTSDDPETLVSMETMSDADIETDSSERKGRSDGSSDGTHRMQRKTVLGVGGKFRRLQMKWELLTGSGSESRNGSTKTSPETSPIKSVRPRVPSNSTVASPAASPIKSSSSRSSLTGGASPSGSSTASTSRIPRPITSPVRPPSGIPVLSSSKKLVSPTQQPSGLPHSSQLKRPASASVRASRADQPTAPGEHRIPALRPSSLPYSPATHSQSDKNKKTTPQRRATSASVSRNAKQTNKTSKSAQRLVRTVKHQLASDSGHLSFSSGERLVLVLEVDEHWLLCRKGDRMGLVRRSAVVATQDHLAGF